MRPARRCLLAALPLLLAPLLAVPSSAGPPAAIEAVPAAGPSFCEARGCHIPSAAWADSGGAVAISNNGERLAHTITSESRYRVPVSTLDSSMLFGEAFGRALDRDGTYGRFSVLHQRMNGAIIAGGESEPGDPAPVAPLEMQAPRAPADRASRERVGEVAWSEDAYLAGGAGVVRIWDPSPRWDGEALDSLVAIVRSDTDPRGIEITATETGKATGEFEGTVFFAEAGRSAGHRLAVSAGDTVTAEYWDDTLPEPRGGFDEIDVTAEALIGGADPHPSRDGWGTGTVGWLEQVYPPAGTAVIRVADADRNLDPHSRDGFSVAVRSERDPRGISLAVRETLTDSGVFEGTVFLSNTNYSSGYRLEVRESSGHRLEVGEYDTITARYTDRTLPVQFASGSLGIEALAEIRPEPGAAYPPSARIEGDPEHGYSSYAFIELDGDEYSWTDRVRITIRSHDHSLDDEKIDRIGDSGRGTLTVSTSAGALRQYALVETDTDTGVFKGEVTLVGFPHFAAGHHAYLHTGGEGPAGGLLESGSDDVLDVSFEFAPGLTALASAPIGWSPGEVRWNGTSHAAGGAGTVIVEDPDMNLDPDVPDSFSIDVRSDTDPHGIAITVTETGGATGTFEGAVSFAAGRGSPGRGLAVAGGDVVAAKYVDRTLPEWYAAAYGPEISAATLIDAHPAGGAAASPFRHGTGQILWLEAWEYTESGAGAVRVVDPDRNLHLDVRNSLDVTVRSDSDPGGIHVTLVETGESTGIFEGAVPFAAADGQADGGLAVAEGDTVTAEYRDVTVEGHRAGGGWLEVEATRVIGPDRQHYISSRGMDQPDSDEGQAGDGGDRPGVQCPSNLVHVFSPGGIRQACVHFDTAGKLADRGWSFGGSYMW